MKTNYHTHHELCGHADGKAWDYVEEAIKQGFKVLGFSDHAPSNDIKDYGVRMKMDELDTYIDDIKSAKHRAGEKIEILTGLEVEYFPNNEEYYEFLKEKTDYLIHGQHYISHDEKFDHLVSGFGLNTKEEIIKYADFLEQAIYSDHFLMLAHPDLYMFGYKEWDETSKQVAHRICKAAESKNMILEYNSNGYRRRKQKTTDGMKNAYPRKEFWEVVKTYNIRTVINSDCHTPEFLYDDVIKEAEEDYLKLGLKTIEFIDLNDIKKR